MEKIEKNNKILILPDIHGRKFWLEPCFHEEEFDKIVFLGDYVDPYTSIEGITKAEALDNFKEILKFKDKTGEKTIMLLGNHDLSYIERSMPKCRYDYENGEEISALFEDYQESLNIGYECMMNGKHYIFTHCGIEMDWLYYSNLDGSIEEDKLSIVSLINKLYHTDRETALGALGCISYYRGGCDTYSSCVWGDVREFDNYMRHHDNKPIDNAYQIFGHTMLETPIICDKYACIDAKQAFILEDNKLRQYDYVDNEETQEI